VTDAGWFAARPSGTEDVYKIYAECFAGPDGLALIQEQAQEVVSDALNAGADEPDGGEIIASGCFNPRDEFGNVLEQK